MRLSIVASPIAALVLSACAAPSTAPTYSQVPAAEPREGMAVLYVYREYAEPTAWSPTISIDGKEFVSLPQQGFSWVYVSPGKRTFLSKWSFLSGSPPVEFSAEFVAGTRYFFEITGTSRLTGTSSGGAGLNMHFTTIAQINSPKEREAVRQLEKCCRFISPNASAL